MNAVLNHLITENMKNIHNFIKDLRRKKKITRNAEHKFLHLWITCMNLYEEYGYEKADRENCDGK